MMLCVLAAMSLFCCMQRALQSIPGIQHRKGLPGRFCCFSWIMGPASSSIARRRPIGQTVGRPVGLPLDKLLATLGRLTQSPAAVSSLVGLRCRLPPLLFPLIDNRSVLLWHHYHVETCCPDQLLYTNPINWKLCLIWCNLRALYWLNYTIA